MDELAASPPDGIPSGHEPFYDHRVPPYPCPACDQGVLSLRSETLHCEETADSRRLYEINGPSVGEGVWRFSCLFVCGDADCKEVVACIGAKSWSPDPQVSFDPQPRKPWMPGMGPLPDIGETLQQMQAEIVLRYSPMHFLPPLRERSRASIVDEVSVAEDFIWMTVRGVTYRFTSGLQADTIRVLYETWKASGFRDGSGLSRKVIGQKTGSTAEWFKVEQVFDGHPALGAILRRVGKGQWALFLGRGSAETDCPDEESTAA